ncbi:MAG TPA: insulinase family protein [Bacteroidetes bacterium]|nr:insulinase family protein [Bacteroidota bacterium]
MIQQLKHASLLFFVPALVVAQSVDTKEFTLGNALKVVMVEDHTVPSVTFAVGFHVGSRNERPGITGISHLFEHMMFNGSKNYKPTEFDKILENGGGYSNAYTSNDITFYYEEFNPDLLDKVLDMEADRMRSLKLDTANIEQERGIVKEERRVSTDNSVRGKIFEDLYAAAYVAHPYHNPVVGWMGDLDNITLQDAKDYFKIYYAPNNATVFVVGDFDSKMLRKKMEKLFGNIPRQPTPRPVVNAEPEQQGEKRLKLHKVAELPAVAIAYKGASVESSDIYALNLLSTILSRGQSSRLYKKLVYDEQICTEVGTGMDELVDPGLFSVFAQMQQGKTVEDAEEEIYKIIADIGENAVSEEELQKAKNTAQSDYVDNFKTNQGVAGRLGFYEVVYGDYKKSFQVIDHYNKVTVDDIKRVAAKYLKERQRTVIVLIPEKSATSSGEAPN